MENGWSSQQVLSQCIPFHIHCSLLRAFAGRTEINGTRIPLQGSLSKGTVLGTALGKTLVGRISDIVGLTYRTADSGNRSIGTATSWLTLSTLPPHCETKHLYKG